MTKSRSSGSPKQRAETSQRQRFIEAARKAGASEDEAVFDETLKRLAKAKPEPTKQKANE